MQNINGEYLIKNVLIFNLKSNNSPVYLRKPNGESVIIDNCCFYNCFSTKEPAAINIELTNVTITKSSFVKMIFKYNGSIDLAASAKLRSDSLIFNYSQATKCDSNSHDNFHVSGQRQQLSYINNSHNKINHITFAYLFDYTESETSFCNVCHNPANLGTELQSCLCDLSRVHHCVFAYNTCSSTSLIILQCC